MRNENKNGDEINAQYSTDKRRRMDDGMEW